MGQKYGRDKFDKPKQQDAYIPPHMRRHIEKDTEKPTYVRFNKHEPLELDETEFPKIGGFIDLKFGLIHPYYLYHNYLYMKNFVSNNKVHIFGDLLI